MTPDTTTTVQLTDAQLAQFTACGLIVVEGEPCDRCNGSGFVSWEEPNRAGGIDIKGMECAACDGTGTVAPKLWRKLCARCGGRGRIQVGPSPTVNYGHAYGAPCTPDCDRGRQVVTLTATCEACGRSGETDQRCKAPACDGGHACSSCLAEGVVVIGRFTIRLLPVVGALIGEVGYGEQGDRLIVAPSGLFLVDTSKVPSTHQVWLDPPPQPGQYAVAFEAVAP